MPRATGPASVTPMAGAERGLYFLPEVDDEVLEAFEHGSPSAPYVLGGLWNGEDTPPDRMLMARTTVAASRRGAGT